VEEVQVQAARQPCDHLLQHPSIRFKHVSDGLWSARVGLAYRALAVKEGEMVTRVLSKHEGVDDDFI
jgi:hypothetical protein